jgi:TolB-like protein
VDKPFPAYRGDEPYVFVCYAHEDVGVVYPILSQLHDQGIRFWYDEGISPGTIWRAELAEKIEKAAVFLVFVSRAFGNSPNCEREVYFALERKCRVLPVYLDEEKLPGAMELSLGGFQAIHRAGGGDSEFLSSIHISIEAMLNGAEAREAEPLVARPRRRNRWQIGAVALLALASILAVWIRQDGDEPTSVTVTVVPDTYQAASTKATVAVLPYNNLTADDSLAYIAEGLADEILDALARSRDFHIISRVSSFWFKGKDVPLAEIAGRLGATHLVSGSIRRDGDRLRIVNQLIRASDQRQLWSKRYDDAAGDLFAFQERVARGVADALNAELSTEDEWRIIEAGFSERTPEQIAAYDHYLKAKHALAQLRRLGVIEIDLATLSEIREHLALAMRLDPSLDIARLTMAQTHLVDSSYKTTVTRHEWGTGGAGMTAMRVLSEDSEAKVRSLLRPSDSQYPEYHRIMATIVRDDQSGDWKEYEEQLRALVAVEPNDVDALQQLASLPSIRPDEKLELLQFAHRLDPLSVASTMQLVSTLKDSDPTEAIAVFHESYQLNPTAFDQSSFAIPLITITNLHLDAGYLDSGLAWRDWSKLRNQTSIAVLATEMRAAYKTDDAEAARHILFAMNNFEELSALSTSDPFLVPEMLSEMKLAMEFQIAVIERDWRRIDELYNQHVPQLDIAEWDQGLLRSHGLPLINTVIYTRNPQLRMHIAQLMRAYASDQELICGAATSLAFACLETGDERCANTMIQEAFDVCPSGPDIQRLSLAKRIAPGSREQELAEAIAAVEVTMDELFLYPQREAINRYLLERDDFQIRVADARAKRDAMLARYEAAKANGTLAELRFRPAND